jgi:Ni/Fe-hydrogenase subunit HybB-like protein
MSLFDRYIDFFITAFAATEGTAIVCMLFAAVFDNPVFAGFAKGVHIVAFVVVAIAGLFLLIDMVKDWLSSNKVTE